MTQATETLVRARWLGSENRWTMLSSKGDVDYYYCFKPSQPGDIIASLRDRNTELAEALRELLTDAENFDLHIGEKRATMIRAALKKSGL